jgi:hypothetical protein
VLVAPAGPLMVLLLCARCTVPPAGGLAGWNSAVRRSLGRGDILEINGSAECDLVLRGEKVRARATVHWEGDSQFTCDFHTSWGAPVASLRSGAEGGEIRVGESLHRFGLDQDVRSVPSLPDYPYTFGELIRIITGIHAFSVLALGEPDTVLADRKGRRYEWWNDSVVVVLDAAHRTGRMEGIRFVDPHDRARGVFYSGFRDGYSREIGLVADESNYFLLRYDHLAVRAGGQ